MAACAISNCTGRDRAPHAVPGVIHDHIGAPVAWVVLGVDIAIGHRCRAAAGGAAGFDVARVVADEQHFLGFDAHLLAGEQQHVRRGFALLDVVGADQHCRARGQIQTLHDRLGITHRFVGGDAPQQARLLDVVEQGFDAVERAGEDYAVFLVALQELLAQGFERSGVRVFIESAGDHGASAAGYLVTYGLVCQWRQATGRAHGLGDGDEVRRRVEQGAVHVEQYSAQTHQSFLSVWIM